MKAANLSDISMDEPYIEGMTVIKTDIESQKRALEAVSKNGSWTAGVPAINRGRSREDVIKAFKKTRAASRKRSSTAA